jgi:hypothetical protein
MMQAFELDPSELNHVKSGNGLPLRVIVLSFLVVSRVMSLIAGAEIALSDLWLFFGVATIVTIVTKWLQGSGQGLDPTPLLYIVRPYAVAELNGVFLYLPIPRRPADNDIWMCVPELKKLGWICGGPWRIDASKTPSWLPKTHPKISTTDIAYYEVHRLRSDLGAMLA